MTIGHHVVLHHAVMLLCYAATEPCCEVHLVSSPRERERKKAPTYLDLLLLCAKHDLGRPLDVFDVRPESFRNRLRHCTEDIPASA